MNRFRHDRTWAILFTGEELDRHDKMIRADERAKCIKILEDNWLCGTVARRVIDDIIEQLKEQNK